MERAVRGFFGGERPDKATVKRLLEKMLRVWQEVAEEEAED